jgi:hypothetical protein
MAPQAVLVEKEEECGCRAERAGNSQHDFTTLLSRINQRAVTVNSNDMD